MAEEDKRSQEVENERRAAEAITREREAYLRDLYTSFDPLWGAAAWGNAPPEDKPDGVTGGTGGNTGGDTGGNTGGGYRTPTGWWRGADAPHIWAGPKTPCSRAPRLTPGSRFVPHAQAVLDGLEPQAVSVGRLSREYLVLLGLPHESVQDMYEKVKEKQLCGVDAAYIFVSLEDGKQWMSIHPTVKKCCTFSGAKVSPQVCVCGTIGYDRINTIYHTFFRSTVLP